jgi:hypothetical protein
MTVSNSDWRRCGGFHDKDYGAQDPAAHGLKLVVLPQSSSPLSQADGLWHWYGIKERKYHSG